MNRSGCGRVDQSHMVGRGEAKNVSCGRQAWSWHGEQDKQNKRSGPDSALTFFPAASASNKSSQILYNFDTCVFLLSRLCSVISPSLEYLPSHFTLSQYATCQNGALKANHRHTSISPSPVDLEWHTPHHHHGHPRRAHFNHPFARQ